MLQILHNYFSDYFEKLNKKQEGRKRAKDKAIKKKKLKQKNSNFMHMHMLPLFLSENMMHLFNNFFIIMTFYLLFLIPMFYKYIQEEKDQEPTSWRIYGSPTGALLYGQFS